jgi:hypothetical protein
VYVYDVDFAGGGTSNGKGIPWVDISVYYIMCMCMMLILLVVTVTVTVTVTLWWCY